MITSRHRRDSANVNVPVESASSDLRQLVALHLEDAAEEVDADLKLLDGRLPAGLDGVWWRNGPGRFERGGIRYGHPFDGDGIVTRFDLSPGGGHVRTRFVRTPEFLAEQRANKILYRGFGTDRPGGITANLMRLRFKNAANTSVSWHAGRLHALWEGGLPTRIEPTTLETLGFDDLGGVLRSRGPIPPTFSAHPCRDAATGTLFNFGLRWGLRQSLIIYAIGADGTARIERTLALDRLTFIHDFMLTPRWFVFLLPAVRFDVARIALGLSAPARSLRGEPGVAMTALLVPRDGGDPVAIETVPGFVFHLAGAFEDEHGRVICDAMQLAGVPDLDHLDALFAPGGDGGCAVPIRLVLDPKLRRMVDSRQLADIATELPITAVANGVPYRSFWATAVPSDRRQPYYSSLVRVDTERGVAASCELFPALPSEPCFVRRPDASHVEHGWLLSVIHRPGSCAELWVFDAQTLQVEARLGLPARLPPGLHGCWASRATT